MPILAFVAVAAPGTLEARVEAILAPELARTRGIAVAISRGGRIVFERGYGFSDLAGQTPVTPTTRFKIGSMTKAFTAAAVARLAAERKLDLDGSIVPLLPGAPETWRKVTVRDLLNHTSGIPSWTDAFGMLMRSRKPGDPREILRYAATRPLDFEPGARYAYSNTNYNLLGMIAERVAGRPLGVTLTRDVFRPLRMTRTTYETSGFRRPEEAEGTYFANGRFVPSPPIEMSWPGGAGAIVSTAGDMTRWLDSLGGRLLPVAMWREVFAPRRTLAGLSPYGFGWIVEERLRAPLWVHGGSVNGFAGFAIRAPKSRVSVAFLTNSGEKERVRSLALRLLNAADPPSPPPTKPMGDPDPTLSARLRQAAEDLFRGRRDPVLFDPAFLAAIPDADWARVGAGLAALGPLENWTLARTGSDEREYVFSAGGEWKSASFRLTPDGRIKGMLVR